MPGLAIEDPRLCPRSKRAFLAKESAVDGPERIGQLVVAWIVGRARSDAPSQFCGMACVLRSQSRHSSGSDAKESFFSLRLRSTTNFIHEIRN